MVPQEPKADSPLRSIGATNGRMLEYLKTYGGDVHILENKLQGESESRPLWEQALMLALTNGMDAFIDAGALLVGVSTAEAAAFVRGKMDGSRYRGVVYSSVDGGGRQEWRVQGPQGQEWPLVSSPVVERDAFVIFDQHQCRGADMKLRQQAKALLSLGPRLCKDALMQAAGRMRQLGRGQTLAFVLPCVIASDVRRVCKLDTDSHLLPDHLLRWVLANAIAATETALPMWAHQGLHFVRFKQLDGDAALVEDERLSLEMLYGHARKRVTVAEGVKSQSELLLGDEDQLVQAIDARAQVYGGDVEMVGTRTDEECERELERLQELENELEKEEDNCNADQDQKWDVSSAFAASVPLQATLVRASGLKSLTSMLNDANAEWMALGWNQVCDGRVFCTRNFAHPIEGRQHPDHMHVANMYLYWPATGQVLLLSPWEADAALKAYWNVRRASKDAPLLGHIIYARRVADASGCKGLSSSRVPLSLPVGNSSSSSCPTAAILAALQLFNGETRFGTTEDGDERQRVLENDLINSSEAAHVASQLAEARGKQSELMMSHLEKAIHRH